MHTRSEWNRVHENLVMMDDTLHEHSIINSFQVLVIRVLLMLVEDKIKAVQK